MSAKLVFSSNDLPPQLSETAKFNLWRDIYVGEIAALDISVSTNTAFTAQLEAMAVGPLTLSRMEGSITGVARTAAHVAAGGSDDYCLLINTGAAPMGGLFRQHEAQIAAGAAALQTFGEPLSLVGGDTNAWVNIVIPRQLLTTTFGGIDEQLAVEIGPANEALGLLRGYCAMLDMRGPLVSPGLIAHTVETIIDLVGLATGAKGESTELAGMRGLKAARLSAILASIKRNFADPHCSALSIAQELGLSLRYVHNLLQASGIGFSERVLELRLQRTRTMLADRRHDHLRVSEVALVCGFSDISYFNRSFRRRFGITPSSAR